MKDNYDQIEISLVFGLLHVFADYDFAVIHDLFVMRSIHDGENRRPVPANIGFRLKT